MTWLLRAAIAGSRGCENQESNPVESISPRINGFGNICPKPRTVTRVIFRGFHRLAYNRASCAVPDQAFRQVPMVRSFMSF